jgi:RNAse (barnase) inhibitor barstar
VRLPDGPVVLYRNRSFLDEDIWKLRTNGFRVAVFDAAKWVDTEQMHTDLAAGFGFPDYYGRNLDALNDCLSEAVLSEPRGLVLACARYDIFATKDPDFAWSVLDLIAHVERLALRCGLRLIAMIQSDDPDIRFDPVGASEPLWNHREQADRNRRKRSP